ncbi:hypothetical protein E9677_23630 [Rhizobium rhizophilum]|uniref:Type I secretion protein n=2 Tax=Rhizobium rhizophilum TaxID=1850373 RepID=A0ABY2QNS7_9HYPH|nr:hypothetical protein E9677_23630 [Rhizobium rhizophilum]
MTTMDKFTEEISHFIGFFHISLENARAREAYTEFAVTRAQFEVEKLPVHTSEFGAPFDLLGFDPSFGYRSPAPDHWYVPTRLVDAPPVPADRTVGYAMDGRPLPDLFKDAAGTPMKTAHSFSQEIDPPGSIVNHFSQAISLSDDDYFGVGGHGLAFNPDTVDDAAVLGGFEEASALSPLGNFARAGSSEDLIGVIETVIEQLEDVPADHDAIQLHISATSIDGIYVNGELVEETPVIEDYHTFDDDESGEEEDVDDQSVNTWISDDGTVVIDASVEVHTGGNTLINNVVLQNIWTGATMTVVGGDHVEANAIVQINALWDADDISAAVSGWTKDASANEMYNIATFDHLDTSNGSTSDASGADGYPAFWAVTEIHGDLMIVNWLEQIIFMTDDDVGIISSSGVTTSVIAGDNFAVNHASVFELGFFYDLIIIGGSIYDANIIHQMNVLFDNDLIGATADFQTSGEGSFSSSGNLLWNEARIGTIGDADRFDTLSQDHADTLASFADGNGTVAPELLSDEAFAGLQGLRVLYISGDLINLQYIRQTNILGDSDQIALAMDAISPDLDATWTVETGSNALINNATIIDLDSVGKTYIGGEQYSQETLFQAELITSHPDFGNPNPDALVTEAVLFLDDSMLDQGDHSPTYDASCLPSDYDGQTGDGVNSMIGH